MALSIEYGPTVDTTNVSHLQMWQDVVNAQPNAIALISRHQSPQSFAWVSGQYTDKDHLQWTYTELDRGARRLATCLSRLTHIERRPIAALINNQAEWALFYWASAYLHSPFVPINPKTATRVEEINHMLDLVGPAVLVAADPSIATQLEQSLTEKLTSSIPVKLVLSRRGDDTQQSWSLLSDILTADPTPPDTPDMMTANDTMLILFTSGTTSLPKPCALTSFQCLNAALGYMDSQKITSSHRFVQHLPGFHSYGIGWSLGVWLRGGIIIFPSESFEAQASLECFDLFKATHMSLVPTTAQAILAHPAFPKTDLSSLVSIDVSGAGVLPSLINTCASVLKVPSCTSYGMTESPGTLTWPVDGGSVIRNGEVMSGRPARATVVKVCEPGTQNVVPRGQIGELHNGGPQVIPHYMDPRVSTDSFYQDEQGTRWIITGDQAVMDEDGAVRICGRYKDMIIRGGENISPASIEDYLSKQEGVYTAQVVGAPDEMAGEVPIAVITTKEGFEVNTNDLKQATSKDLGPAFAPKIVLHLNKDLGLDAFPCTASGKIRKVELAQIVREYLKKQQEASVVDQSALTIDSLIKIWESISGTDALLPSSSVNSFADSLMMMQLSSIVKRDLGRDIMVEDFKTCDTIQNQADLIDSRPLISATIVQAQREGPPTLQDMPHARDSPDVFERTKASVLELIKPYDLTWDDIEDVVPLPDWDAIFCHRSRPTSWNLRFTYHAPVSAAQLEAAIMESLTYHPTLRSLALQDHDDESLLVSVRATNKWMQACMTTGWKVQEKEDLKTLLLDDPELDAGVAPGPLVRFHIAKVESDNSSGLIFVGTHAVHDMSMTKLWLEDVATLLKGEGTVIPHAPFRDYATAFYNHRDGVEAANGTQYWAEKLQGLGSVPESNFWPAQRTVEWFKGNDAGWSRWNGTRARTAERTTSLTEKMIAQRGLRRRVPIDDIFRLKSEHGVPVFMLVKAAIALLNVTQTGGTEAFFGTINAARTWPFSSDYTSLEREAYAVRNPLDISGCTTEYVLDRVPVPPSQSLLAFLQHVTYDEERNSGFAHAPFRGVLDRLRDPIGHTDLRSFAARDRDADAVLPLIRRQSFNWLPTAPTAGDQTLGLRMLEMLSRMDNGLTISGFLCDDKRSVALGFSWDAEHLSLSEGERALDLLAGLVARLGREENWGKTVGEVLRM